jgi:hypothetical protein
MFQDTVVPTWLFYETSRHRPKSRNTCIHVLRIAGDPSPEGTAQDDSLLESRIRTEGVGNRVIAGMRSTLLSASYVSPCINRSQ